MNLQQNFTKIVRTTTYPAIDPSRPELSAAGKTVVVTGAGAGGIGGAVALSFAKAGASKIALIGPDKEGLEATKRNIESSYPDATVQVDVADVSKAESIGLASHNIRSGLGAWDVFAHCAGFCPRATTIAGADEDEWWSAFEVNAKFSLFFAKHFLPKRRPNATYIGVGVGGTDPAASLNPGKAAYSASKLAAAKLDEYLALENPNLRVFTLNPGGVDPAVFGKHATGAQIPPGDHQVVDPSLPADFMVWLASSEAEFLRPVRALQCNLDVEELVSRWADTEGNPRLLSLAI